MANAAGGNPAGNAGLDPVGSVYAQRSSVLTGGIAGFFLLISLVGVLLALGVFDGKKDASPTKASQSKGVLRTDGLYQSTYFEVDKFRFYDDGVVIAVCASGDSEKIWKWFTRENIEAHQLANGQYEFDGSRLTFSTVGTVSRMQYEGTVEGDGLVITEYNMKSGVRRQKMPFHFVQLGPPSRAT